TSVHSFAADPGRGLFILAFLVLTIGGSLALYVWRAPLLRSSAGFDLVSRESFLLFNNILLVVATAVVFGGTLAPLIADATGRGTLSVGPPYFNSMFLLPVLPLLALVSLGTFARWKRGQLGEARARIWGGLALSVVLGLALVTGVYGDRSLLGPIGTVLGLWIVVSSLFDPLDRLRRGLSIPPAIVGMTLAHIGLGVITVGITVMESTMVERDVALGPGQEVTLGDYTFRFEGVEEADGPNYAAIRGRVLVREEGGGESVLLPERRNYFVTGQALA